MTDARFRDMRLPDFVSVGAVGGPQFKTTIVPLGSGFEKANMDWQSAACKFDIGHVAREKTLFDATRAFYYVAAGKFYAWRFKDHADYELGLSGSPVGIGIGDGSNTSFQLIKPYSFAGFTYNRILRCIVAATYGLYVDGTQLVEGSGAGKFTLDLVQGLATLGTAPASSKVVAAYCQFDVCCRFDTDWGNFTVDIGGGDGGEGVHSWPSLPLIEYRLKF